VLKICNRPGECDLVVEDPEVANYTKQLTRMLKPDQKKKIAKAR
jgi:hypothetical protein